jgi:hypothetical protein
MRSGIGTVKVEPPLFRRAALHIPKSHLGASVASRVIRSRWKGQYEWDGGSRQTPGRPRAVATYAEPWLPSISYEGLLSPRRSRWLSIFPNSAYQSLC